LLLRLFISIVAAPLVAAMAITWLFIRPARRDLGGN
jgi:hypothetical protein